MGVIERSNYLTVTRDGASCYRHTRWVNTTTATEMTISEHANPGHEWAVVIPGSGTDPDYGTVIETGAHLAELKPIADAKGALIVPVWIGREPGQIVSRRTGEVAWRNGPAG